MVGATKRIRKAVEPAKAAILAAAERHLIEEGPAGVKVQRIARELGITDAAIHYHFKSRQGLLEHLLREAGRKFADDLQTSLDASPAKDPTADLATVAAKLMDLYGQSGTAKLATWLILSGWSPPGQGMLSPLVEWYHRGRLDWALRHGLAQPTAEESAKLIATVSAVTFTYALTGDALIRSSGLSDTSQTAFLDWIAGRLGGPPAG